MIRWRRIVLPATTYPGIYSRRMISTKSHFTEVKNAVSLQWRARKTTVNSKGRFNRKKRFGKPIRNRCPGYFQTRAKQVFESTGGKYVEVPNDYRASQYDHTSSEYVMKKLSERMFDLSDGTLEPHCSLSGLCRRG